MIIWLASYPKSGNTWIRSFISALLYTDDGQNDFSNLKKIRQFPARSQFKDFVQDLQNPEQVYRNWTTVQNFLNLDKKIKFLKTHHLKCKIGGYNFTSKKNTLATIYIVRDPRNLVNSISNHYSKTLEEAKEFLLTPKYLFGFKKDTGSKTNNIKTILGTWSEHYKFWKTNNENFLLIKYENLLNNINSELEKIVLFLRKYIDFDINNEKLKNIVQTTNFHHLKKGEQKGLFNENVFARSSNQKINFFYQGPENDWKSKLEDKIVDEINLKFKSEMIELGYL